jgi:hypothetical protein
LFIPDPDFFSIPDLGSSGKKITWSRTRIRNIEKKIILFSHAIWPRKKEGNYS